MGIAISSVYPAELAKPNAALVAGTPEGTLLMTGSDGLETFATDPNLIDGILVAAVVDATTAFNQTFIYKDVDYSGYVLAGDQIVVARQFDGATCYGFAVEPPIALVAAGTTLILGSNGRLKARPAADTTSQTVAVALDPIQIGAVTTGTIHFRNR